MSGTSISSGRSHTRHTLLVALTSMPGRESRWCTTATEPELTAAVNGVCPTLVRTLRAQHHKMRLAPDAPPCVPPWRPRPAFWTGCASRKRLVACGGVGSATIVAAATMAVVEATETNSRHQLSATREVAARSRSNTCTWIVVAVSHVVGTCVQQPRTPTDQVASSIYTVLIKHANGIVRTCSNSSIHLSCHLGQRC